MAWQNLREDLEELFSSLPAWHDRPADGFGMRTPSAAYMREWRRLNPQLAREAVTRDAERKRLKRAQNPKPPRVRVSKVPTLDLLRLLHEGLSGKAIAAKLGVSESAVSKARRRQGVGLVRGSNQFKKVA